MNISKFSACATLHTHVKLFPEASFCAGITENRRTRLLCLRSHADSISLCSVMNNSFFISILSYNRTRFQKKFFARKPKVESLANAKPTHYLTLATASAMTICDDTHEKVLIFIGLTVTFPSCTICGFTLISVNNLVVNMCKIKRFAN